MLSDEVRFVDSGGISAVNFNHRTPKTGDSRMTSTFDLARTVIEEGAGREIHFPAEGLLVVATFSSKNHLCPASPGAKQFPSLA
jgi:hypothetical protein